jgi:hypothetical protein
VLANANSSFLLTERRRHYARYLGALAFFEINGPSGAHVHLLAARARCACACSLRVPGERERGGSLCH